MTEFLLTLGFVGALMLLMAIGVILKGKELKGSCGGVDRCLCEISGRPIPDHCKEIKDAVKAMQASEESAA